MAIRANAINYSIAPILGADPEIFVRDKDGSILGSELVIPACGLGGLSYNSKVTRDGVQVEFQPCAGSGCRQSFSIYLAECFHVLYTHLTLNHPGTTISLDQVVTLTEDERARLSPKSRELGCQPSLNIYGPAPITVETTTYPVRSAGGHIHLGLWDTYHCERLKHLPMERLVGLFDILVGLPSVLLDRDPRAAERREVYGRAGEYRIQPHGIEYRTLSNFWLRSYPLMSLMTALMRMALNTHVGHAEGGVYNYSTNISYKYTYDDEATRVLLEQFDPHRVSTIINTNDASMAIEEVKKIQAWTEEWVVAGVSPLHSHAYRTWETFWHLAEVGLDQYWPRTQKAVQNWVNRAKGEFYGNGWEAFASYDAKIKRRKAA